MSKISLVEPVDQRALVLFRISIALLLIWDLICRLPHVHSMYTDHGLFPRAMVLEMDPGAGSWGPYFLSGEAAWTYFLFFVSAIVAGLLLIGLKSQWMMLSSWFLLTSLQYRSPFVNFGAHALLRTLCFWSIFVPLDGNLATKGKQRSFATFCLLLQPILVYGVTALEKTGSSWIEGTAVHYALKSGAFATPVGEWILQFPLLAKLLTYFTYLLEFIAPVLLLLSQRFRRIRLGVLLALFVFQMGLLFSMRLGFFPLISTVACLPFLPARSASPPPFQFKWKRDLILVPALALSLFFHMKTTRKEEVTFHPFIKKMLSLTHLNQEWKLFSPEPSRKRSWIVLTGSLRDGSMLDLAPQTDPRKLAGPLFSTDILTGSLWRKYLSRLPEARFKEARGLLANFFCKDWAGRIEGGGLDTVEISWRSSIDSQVSDELLWTQPCL